MSISGSSVSESTSLLSVSAPQHLPVSGFSLPLSQLGGASSSASDVAISVDTASSDVKYLQDMDEVGCLLEKGEQDSHKGACTAVGETYCGNGNVNSSRSSAACKARYCVMAIALIGILALIVYSQTDSQAALYIGSGGLALSAIYSLCDCIASTHSLDEDGNLQEGNLCNGVHSTSTPFLSTNWGCFHTVKVSDAMYYLSTADQEKISKFVDDHHLKIERDTCYGCCDDSHYLKASLESFMEKLSQIGATIINQFGFKNSKQLASLQLRSQLLRGIQEAELRRYSDATTTEVDYKISPRVLTDISSPRSVVGGSSSVANTPNSTPQVTPRGGSIIA